MREARSYCFSTVRWGLLMLLMVLVLVHTVNEGTDRCERHGQNVNADICIFAPRTERGAATRRPKGVDCAQDLSQALLQQPHSGHVTNGFVLAGTSVARAFVCNQLGTSFC